LILNVYRLLCCGRALKLAFYLTGYQVSLCKKNGSRRCVLIWQNLVFPGADNFFCLFEIQGLKIQNLFLILFFFGIGKFVS
jgi:hypothetical protein